MPVPASRELKLPAMGLGTWSFGGGEYWGPQAQADVDDVVGRAIDLGLTYFDTAEMYNGGASEASLGQALRGRRDRVLIGSKLSPANAAPAVLRARCEASLGRLQTDRIDLYMMHWPIHADSIRHFTKDESVIAHPPSTRDAFLALGALQREGKIRHIGVSNFGVRQLQEVLDLGVEIAANELPYNLLMRGIELELLPFCRSRGIAVIGYMTLMQGVLAGDFASFDELPPIRTRTRHFSGRRAGSRHGEAGFETETFAALQAIRTIARDENLPLSDLALAWALANPALSCVLAGCRNSAQLEENARALRVKLSVATIDRLNAATSDLRAKLGPNPDFYQGAAHTRIW
ncbi:MAG TPA: aldo/keto reductase [Opitutaceae bacterium]|nr:aldo/keto reductase [Opitutaceae bacterium]